MAGASQGADGRGVATFNELWVSAAPGSGGDRNGTVSTVAAVRTRCAALNTRRTSFLGRNGKPFGVSSAVPSLRFGFAGPDGCV